MSLNVLTANESLYVATTGNDSNNGLSSGNAVATIDRALEIIGGMYIGEHTVTVHVADGTYNNSDVIMPNCPHGSNVVFEGGTTEEFTNGDVNWVGSLVGEYDNMYYYSLRFQLASTPTKAPAAGDFVKITDVSGDTYGKTLRGVHEVTSYDSNNRNVIIKVWVDNDSHVNGKRISTSASVDGEFIYTVLNFNNNSNGIKMVGPKHGGHWDNMVFKGSSPIVGNGIWMMSGSVISFGSSVGFSGWKNALYAQNNGCIYADYTAISYANYLVSCQNAGVVSVRWAYLSGSRSGGIYAFNAGSVTADGCYLSAMGHSQGAVWARNRGFVQCPDCEVFVCGNYTFLAHGGGYINADDASVSYNDLGVEEPSSSPGNNNSYILY